MTRYRMELGALVLALGLAACQEAADDAATSAAGDGLPEGAEAVSLLGEPLYPSPASAEQAQDIEVARADYDADPDDADAIIWLGRRVGYTGAFRDAIGIFSEGIEKHPDDARMYRHRGHRWIIDAIPRGQKMAISAGIGIFLGVIALRNAGIIEGSPATLVTVGELTAAPAVLALLGFCAIAALSARRIPGAAILGMLGATAIGLILGVSEWHGFASLPPDPTPTLFALDIGAALQLGMIAVIFTFLIVDLFDTAGTLIGVAHQADLLDDDGRLPRIQRALMADSTGTVAGTLLGTSSVTSYIESAAGVSAGGRTGLTAVVVAGLFLVCLFLRPLAESVPSFATAAAILYVACLMTRALKDVEWDDITESAAAVVTAIAIPLTYSIADGIGLGFITYVAIKVLAGRWRECPPMLLVVALVFAAKFIWL